MTKIVIILIFLSLPIFAKSLNCKDSLKICETELQETKIHRDKLMTKVWEAEARTTGLLEVGACILVGTGVGFIAGNTLLGAASAGTGCFLALPF